MLAEAFPIRIDVVGVGMVEQIELEQLFPAVAGDRGDRLVDAQELAVRRDFRNAYGGVLIGRRQELLAFERAQA